MRKTRLLLAPLIGLLCCPPFGAAEFPSTQPWPGVICAAETRGGDLPQRLFVVRVDLEALGAKVRVSPGGDDPDGEGPWQTTLMTVRDVADRDGYELAINGDFFSVETVIDPETNKRRPYFVGQKGLAIGPAVTDGRQWGNTGKPTPVLAIDGEGRGWIGRFDQIGFEPRQVIAGNVLLVRGGEIVASENPARHPRTAVGLADGGRTLVLLTVDGRRPGIAAGMSYAELAAEFVHLGCTEALNLDGGGSSTLVLRHPTSGALEIVNNPSDGRERPVVNVLGVDVAP